MFQFIDKNPYQITYPDLLPIKVVIDNFEKTRLVLPFRN